MAFAGYNAKGNQMKDQTSLEYLPALFLTISTITTLAASADQNWPQWRGPLQSGVAPAANPPITWSETNNLKWKVKIPGDGTATPIIWEKQVFIQTAIPTGKKVELKAGETNDQRQAEAGRPEPGGPRFRGAGGGPGSAGGPGGPGGFGPGNLLGERMVSDGGKAKEEKLSLTEFTNLASVWFEKLDTEKSGKLDQEKFGGRFGNIF